MRPHVLWTAALVWLALALTQSASAVPVFSDPGEPAGGPFTVVNAAGGMPENGAVLIQGPYEGEPQVSAVTAGTVTSLAGMLSKIEGSAYWVWRPSQPFVAGTAVELELLVSTEFGDSSNVATFQVVPAIELVKPPITLAPSASLLSVISDRACCRARVGSTATLEDSAPCFGIEYESSIQVDPGISSSAPRLLTNQYLFRFTTGPDERPSFAAGSLGSVVLPIFREQADQYCFDVTAIELPTLVEHAYEPSTGCADHGALADLGRSPAQPGPGELTRDACRAPPVGLEDAWCQVNAACEDGEDTSSCGLYAHVCEGEPLAPLASSGLDPNDAGPSGSGAGGTGEADAADGPPAGKGGSEGCSVGAAQASGRTTLGLGWAAALATAIAARRRRRSRARVCHAVPEQVAGPGLGLRIHKSFERERAGFQLGRDVPTWLAACSSVHCTHGVHRDEKADPGFELRRGRVARDEH